MESKEGKDEGTIEGSIRFYAELNGFLKGGDCNGEMKYRHCGRRSVKDLIENFGIPHVEVDLILVNGESVGLDRIVEDGDRIGVYPMFERFNVKGLSKLREIPLRATSFAIDVHLGKLAKYLRLMGFDADYVNDRDDDEILRISNAEGRIILTCDRQMLKRCEVVRGMLINSRKPQEQLAEVLERLDIKAAAKPFSRCMQCNGSIEEITDETEFDQAFGELPQRVKTWCKELYICRACGKLYWKGSNYQKMVDFVDGVLGKGEKR
ncbi:MAG: twitching motility protein PilT [Clostridiales bacterium]|nr:MAG: twitching motility protein PilT [Clostridiales bacterium]